MLNKKCNSCKELIDSESKTCSHCGNEQSKFHNFILKHSVFLSIIISFGVLLLAIKQFKNSEKQRTKAVEAAENAQTALTKIKLIRLSIDSIYSNIDTVRQRSEEAGRMAERTLNKIEKLDSSYKTEQQKFKHNKALSYNLKENISFAVLRSKDGKLFNSGYNYEYRDITHARGYMDFEKTYLRCDHIKMSARKINQYYFDLFEITFISWLTRNYWTAWERGNFHKSFGGESFNSPRSTVLNRTIWKRESIARELKHNLVWRNAGGQIMDIVLPPDTEISTNREYSKIDSAFYSGKLKRSIFLTNEIAKYHITIQEGQVLQYTTTNENFKGQENEWFIQEYFISLTSSFNVNNSLSKSALVQNKWFNNMFKLLKEQYSWEYMEEHVTSNFGKKQLVK